jgi:intracellular sulfur oxidation DsrE/DsrF family protein
MSHPISARRSFLNRLNAGAASLAAIALGGRASAQVRSAASARWEPARYEKDNWLDEVPGKHRLVFDTVSPEGFGEALLYANNFMIANRTDYGLANSDLAIVIVARHRSTAFAYNDAMWAKYGTPIATMSNFEDPKTKSAPKTNLFNAAESASSLPSRGTTVDALVKQGVQFAVCSMATRAVAGTIARAVGGSADDINAELIANLVPNARMVAAGILAVSRAQERGYSVVRA